MPNEAQIARRRSFAIISHPDAGKTTLTEKLLLYGGAVALAGSVTARKNQRATTSDWMELEKQRGISVSSTVLQFEYKDSVVNLLDTPGHKDFSEDTYRVLTAVDAAIMVIDAGKGIEAQTRKLFEVCRRRGVPIFTFMNKLDRPAREPLALLDDLETVLGIGACPINWPLGLGQQFRGVYDRIKKDVHLFERTAHGAYRAPEKVGGLDDDFVAKHIASDALEQAKMEIEMLEGAGHAYDRRKIDRGELTPVFFGSASNNFGVQLLLDGFLDLAPPPAPRMSADGRIIEPTQEAFSGFVFKIQANMDPRHRDRMSFIRIVSGKFERDMQAVHTRTGKTVRLANSQKLFAQDRETVNDAYAGDVVGIVGNYGFGIGDTLSTDPKLKFDEIPRFAPEVFAFLHNPSTAHFKRFRDGLEQLLSEGVVQQFIQPHAGQRVPLLGAVGPLQFEVVQFRLESEYNAASRLEQAPYTVMRWVRTKDGGSIEDFDIPGGVTTAQDAESRWVVFFSDQWAINYFERRNPNAELSEIPWDEVEKAKATE
ncbi:MAG: peptide chain release factor 3 [Verrucomicrobiaceae bacterium]|nr:peptide chain release factor 3 [Verrucomicrobiaceae bacterium]